MTNQSKPQMTIALAWYRAGEWEALKAFCEDRDELESSYDEWRSNAEKALRDLKGKGFQVQAVDFKLEEFKQWCEANRKQPVATARSEFAVFKSREQHQSTNKTETDR